MSDHAPSVAAPALLREAIEALPVHGPSESIIDRSVPGFGIPRTIGGTKLSVDEYRAAVLAEMDRWAALRAESVAAPLDRRRLAEAMLRHSEAFVGEFATEPGDGDEYPITHCHEPDCVESIERAYRDAEGFPALAAAPPALDAAPGAERYLALAMAVMQVRDFLALHRKATGRSDVNIRKVLALIDDALSGAATPASGEPARPQEEKR